jgi:uncharacterized DUF497 family protein
MVTMSDYSSRGKRVRRPLETVEESMRAHYRDPSDKRDLKAYASELEAGDITPPLELQGDEVSLNGQCEWDKKKAFINLYKHGIGFETASLVYSPSPPSGYEIIYDDPTDDGTGFESFWGIDIRDKVLARLGGNGCVMIKVDRDYVNSKRIRLVSVQRVSEREVLKAIREHEVNSSVSVMVRVAVASHPRKPALFKNPLIKADINRRIQAYENIRYMASIMKRV